MCTSNCPTQDHKSWGECVRSKGLRVLWAKSAQGLDADKEKAWDQELQAYSDARKQGIQPSGTSTRQVQNAVMLSDYAGKPADMSKPDLGVFSDD